MCIMLKTHSDGQIVRGLQQNKLILGRLNRFAHQLHAFYLTGSPIARNNSKNVTPFSKREAK